MDLDKKIESIDDIFTPFNNPEHTRCYIADDGYFASNFEDFSDLSICHHGTLDLVREDNKNPSMYRIKETGVFYKYFLSSTCVQFPEPRFRPFNMTEFMKEFPFGTTVSFRRKTSTVGYFRTIFTGYTVSTSGLEPDKDVCLGSEWYSFKELAEEFEYRNDSGEWVAFGVKEL